MFGSITKSQVTQVVIQRLYALQQALDAATDLYGWTSGIAASDLVALGFSQADADSILAAVADANGLAEIYTTGTDPRNPGAGYVYAASQRQVIGPQ